MTTRTIQALICSVGISLTGLFAGAALEPDVRTNGDTTEYRQDLIALANGTLTVGSESVGQTTVWTSGSGTVTVVPVPTTGFAFSVWKGDLKGVTPAADGTLELPANAAHRLVAVFVRTPDTAKTRTWTGAVSSDWNEDGNWTDGSAAGRPVAGDHVTIPANKSVVLDGSTPQLGSLDVSGTLATTNWETCVKADNVIIPNGGKVTVTAMSTDAATNRVWISCGGLMIATGGKIDVNDLGFRGSPAGTWVSCGPGRPNKKGLGASHGGYGGSSVREYTTKTPTVMPYDDSARPQLPGSGGYPDTFGVGTPGGGAVWLEVIGRAVIDGKVLASAATTAGRGSSGSGGAVYLTCDSLSSRGGEIRADGSNGAGIADTVRYQRGGVGGGGMVAVDYQTACQKTDYVSDLVLSVAPGMFTTADDPYGDASVSRLDAGLGTVWLTDNGLLPSLFGKGLTGVLVHMSDDYVIDGDFVFSSGFVRLGRNGVKLTVKGDLTISGAKVRLDIGGLYADNSGAILAIYAGDASNDLTVEGDLTLTSGGRLDLRSAATNESMQVGSQLTVGGVLTVEEAASLHCWSDQANMGSPKITAASLDVREGGLISGFLHGCGIYQGFGQIGTVNVGAGGSHGGSGGRSGYSAIWPESYDDARNPTLPGSGAAYSSGWGLGGIGGGVVQIELSGAAVVNGRINVNGSDGHGAHTAGGGGGGTINIRCKTLSGSGVLSAGGGISIPAVNTSGGGGGGGGRIAVWTSMQNYQPGIKEKRLVSSEGVPSTFAGTFSVAGGLPYSRDDNGMPKSPLDVEQYPQFAGQVGTCFWTDVKAEPGLVIQVR